MPQKYRKKPVVIEAVQYLTDNDFEKVKAFVGDKLFVDMKTKSTLDTGVKINTLEGDLAICRGDFIIKGIKGEFYPCKADIFEQTYEPVTAP
jgi:hypothetical protein